MSVSLRTMPETEREQREAELAGKWADASPHLDERARRIWLGTEARQLGYGGIKFVAQATGAAIETVRGGIADLGRDPEETGRAGRVRQPGGGRKKAEDKDPGLPAALDALLDDDDSEAGDPMSPRLRWTSKSMAKSLPHPDRNRQFGYISGQAAEFAAAGQPVVSVDTKKKELVGSFANGGREWARAGEAPQVCDHDFPSWAGGKAIPCGVYDLGENEGFVSVGGDHDTPAFAVASLESWWVTLGRLRYPDAARLLVTADSGGSSAARSRAYSKHLAAFAERHGLDVTLLHYPSVISSLN